jgi:exopolyphosphatase/guanosine-5'-triphosphate,3'-diphosphate pyrophosphatase
MTETAPAQQSPRVAAVIDIGATSVRMEIAEIDDRGRARTLDSLRHGVSLGKDTFTRGRIQQATIQECVRILKGFRRVMEEHGVTRPEQVRAVATSAVREAENRDTFLDRVYIGAGVNVEAVDEATENRLTYLAAEDLIQSNPDLRGGDVLLVDVGGGSTEVLFLQGGQVTASNSFRMGSLRMRETLETHRTPTERVRTILGQHIERLVEQIRRNTPVSKPTALIAMSGDSRFAAGQLCGDWADLPAARIDYKAFAGFVEKIAELPAERVVRRFHLTFEEAETVGPALLVYLHIARAFKMDQLIVPKASLRDGLLREITQRGYRAGSFADQVVHSALALGRKYQVDEKHARHVANLCLRLFRELKTEHQLGERHELLLEVAALVHEVGGYIGSRSHHKHSMYVIQNSELFGLTREDIQLIALIARYHRRAAPSASHAEYMVLDRDRRIAVSKLAAILRVADAFDRNHLQLVRDFTVTREADRLVIGVRGVEDLTIERLALKDKGNLFEEVYGVPVVVQEVRTAAEDGAHVPSA